MQSPADIARDSGREFLTSHPWITYALRLDRLPWSFWELIGEARSKCRHLAHTPLPPAVAHDLAALYLAKGALATTAIEGNTLTEAQAIEAVRGQLAPPLSQEYLGREIGNIVRACAEIERELSLRDGDLQLTPKLLRHWNAQVLGGLEVADDVVGGEFRTSSVVVGNVYRAAPAGDCEFLVERLCEWLNGPDFGSGEGRSERFMRLLLKALLAHLYIAWIHPFGDGNGRTGRLLEFAILTSAGIPSVAAHLLPNHYNLTRPVYYRELERASRSGGDPRGFLLYAAQGFVDQLQLQLDHVHALNLESAWQSYVHGVFDDTSTLAVRRRRELALALPFEPVPRGELTLLTPSLAAAYAGKGQKTISRDVNALRELDLIEVDRTNIRARREIMLGFLPSVIGEPLF